MQLSIDLVVLIEINTNKWYMSIKYYKLVTVVEGDLKAPFLIATTPRCRKGATPFPGLLNFTIDSYLIMPSVKQGSIKYHFMSLWYDSTWNWTQVSSVNFKYYTDCY